MLRYALLRHECPADYREGPHWDLMIERPDLEIEHRLATWSLQRLPASWAESLGLDLAHDLVAEEPCKAVCLPDHRARYLDYEGEISGGRGTVTRVAGGRVDWITATEETVRARLAEPSGTLLLQKTAGKTWQLRYELLSTPTD